MLWSGNRQMLRRGSGPDTQLRIGGGASDGDPAALARAGRRQRQRRGPAELRRRIRYAWLGICFALPLSLLGACMLLASLSFGDQLSGGYLIFPLAALTFGGCGGALLASCISSLRYLRRRQRQSLSSDAALAAALAPSGSAR